MYIFGPSINIPKPYVNLSTTMVLRAVRSRIVTTNCRFLLLPIIAPGTGTVTIIAHAPCTSVRWIVRPLGTVRHMALMFAASHTITATPTVVRDPHDSRDLLDPSDHSDSLDQHGGRDHHCRRDLCVRS